MSLESETERISKNMARALAEIDRLRADRDRLLAAAKEVMDLGNSWFRPNHAPAHEAFTALQAAIAAAEEPAP